MRADEIREAKIRFVRNICYMNSKFINVKKSHTEEISRLLGLLISRVWLFYIRKTN